MIDLLMKGGPIIWPLLILSILSLAITLERVVFLLKFKFQRDFFQTGRFLKLVYEGKMNDSLQMIQTSKDPLLKAVYDSDINSKNSFQASFQRGARDLLLQIRRGLPLLDTAITLAPLLGLLGTVIGLINAFSSIGADQITAPIAITGGISEALLATAYGLAIAIFCLIPFNIISELESKIREELEDLGTAIELHLS